MSTVIDKSPVTKDLLKSFGERCKSLFRPTAKVNSDEHEYIKISTDIYFSNYWNIWVKIFGYNANREVINSILITSNTQNGIIGTELVLGQVAIDGIAFTSDSNYNLVLSCDIAGDPISIVLVDLIDLSINNQDLRRDTCNRVVELSTTTDAEEVLATQVIGAYSDVEGTAGSIVKCIQTSQTEFTIDIWDGTSKQTISIDPLHNSHIENLYNSHLADYVSTIYNSYIKNNCDITGVIKIGGQATYSSNSELNLAEIINPANQWYNKVKLDSKGRVIDFAYDDNLPVASNNTIGGIKIGFTSTDNHKAVQLDVNTNQAYVDLGNSFDRHRDDLSVLDPTLHIGQIWQHIGDTDGDLTKAYFYIGVPFPSGYSVPVTNTNYLLDGNLEKEFIGIQELTWYGSHDLINLKNTPNVTIRWDHLDNTYNINYWKVENTNNNLQYIVISDSQLNDFGITWKQSAGIPDNNNSIIGISFDFQNQTATWKQINVQPAFEYNGDGLDFITTQDIDDIIANNW